MIASFKSYLEREAGLTFKNFDELHKWSHQETAFWHYVSKFFEFDNFEYPSGTSFDFEKKFISDGINVHSFPEKSKLYRNRFLPKTYRNPAQQIIENFSEKTQFQKSAFIEIHETFNTQKFSKTDLVRSVRTFQQILNGNQLNIGDRVFYVGDFSFKSFTLFLACVANGVIWSSSGPDIGVAELKYKIDATKPKKVFFTNEYRYKSCDYSLGERINNIAINGTELLDINSIFLDSEKIDKTKLEFKRLPWDFPALILFTSGSTGKAKPLLMSLNSIILQLIREVHFNYSLCENDIFYYHTSWGWNMWQWQLAAHSLGSPMVSYCGAAGHPSPSEFIQKFIKIKTSVFGASPSLFNELLNCETTSHQFRQSQIRLLLSTGSVLTASTSKKINQIFGKDVLSLSGGTEIGGALLSGYSDNIPPSGWLGGRVLGVNADIGAINSDGVGELLLKSSLPALPLGLISMGDKRTIESSYFPDSVDIWQHGDSVRKDTNGDFQILGRSDNVIKRKGVRIGPDEISIELMNQFNINSCCFGIRIPNEDYLLALLIEQNINHKEVPHDSTIKEFLQQNLGFRYVPDLIAHVVKIPRNTNGKIVTSNVQLKCENFIEKGNEKGADALIKYIRSIGV